VLASIVPWSTFYVNPVAGTPYAVVQFFLLNIYIYGFNGSFYFSGNGYISGSSNVWYRAGAVGTTFIVLQIFLTLVASTMTCSIGPNGSNKRMSGFVLLLAFISCVITWCAYYATLAPSAAQLNASQWILSNVLQVTGNVTGGFSAGPALQVITTVLLGACVYLAYTEEEEEPPPFVPAPSNVVVINGAAYVTSPAYMTGGYYNGYYPGKVMGPAQGVQPQMVQMVPVPVQAVNVPMQAAPAPAVAPTTQTSVESESTSV
jgi:hypothetical protein